MTGALLRKIDAQQRETPVPSEPTPSDAAQSDATTTDSSPLPGNVTSLHKLALAYHAQKKYEEAERTYQEALAALVAAENPRNREYAQLLNNLGHLYFEQKRYREAEPLYARSLANVEESFGRDHPKVARRLANLADLYFAVGDYSKADACYRRAVSIEEKEFGAKHPATVSRRRAYAAMLRDLSRTDEAKAVEAQAYFSRAEGDRRSLPDRRVRKMRSTLHRMMGQDRRRLVNRRSGKVRRRA
jgi:tetratricopeptide (TPR) repeat protein